MREKAPSSGPNEVREGGERPPAPSRRRLWLFRLLAATGGPLLVFGALELGLHLGAYGHPTDFFLRSDEVSALTSNPAFGWRFFSPAQARRPLAFDVAIPKPEDTLRVVVLGGSAAMGIPAPAVGVARQLEVILADAVAPRRAEVINAAMTAINSHVVVSIARELSKLEPDVVVLYLGHNEVVGPWGPAGLSAPGDRVPKRATIRATVSLLGTRTGQLGAAFLRRVGASGDERTGWRGMARFSEAHLAFGDPRLEDVYDHFERNVRDILTAARRAGAQVLVASPASDLVETPPFASAPRVGESEEELDALIERSLEALARGEADRARLMAEQAVGMNGDHATAHYALGRAWLALGEKKAARLELEKARDLDALRFRADSRIQSILRQLAEERKTEGVRWIDFPERLAAASERGVPGRRYFWEHVHLTFEGSYRLASTLATSGPWELGPILSPEAVAERLGDTDWQRHHRALDIHEMMSRAPFTGQLGHEERMRHRRFELQTLRRAGASPGGLAGAERALRRVLAQRPRDITAQRDLAQVLLEQGRGREAAALLLSLAERLPGAPGLWIDLGNAMAATPDGAGAREAYRRAARLDPWSADVPFNLGVLAAKEQNLAEAVEHFESALELDSTHQAASLNLASALEALGEGDRALTTLIRASERLPEDPLILQRLATTYGARGRANKARQHLENLVERFPSYAPGLLDLAVLRDRAGSYAEAVRLYAACLRLDPDQVAARDQLVALHNRQAAALAQGGDVAGAVTALHKALAAHPDHAASHYNLGLVLGRSGRRGEAIARLQEALELARRHGETSLVEEIAPKLRALGAR